MRTKKQLLERERLARRINHEIEGLRETAPKVSGGVSDDPAIQYMQHVAETYGLGYIPADLGGKPLEQRFADMVNETCDVVRELFGPSWKRFIDHVGMPQGAVRLLSGRKKASQTSINEMRLVHMVLLTHIGGIRQELEDQERRIWVLIQQTHDPQMTGEDGRISYMGHIKRGRQHLREALGDVLKRVPKPYYLPLRALAMIEHPGLCSRAAKELTKHDMITRGELTDAWTSQSFYDGLTDDNIIGLFTPLRRMKNGRWANFNARPLPDKAWYKRWYYKHLEETGKRPPSNRKDWDQETWDSYLEERERVRLTVGDERPIRGEHQAANTQRVTEMNERDLREYMRVRRMERDAERRRFFNWLDKHGAGGAADKVASHLDEVFGDENALDVFDTTKKNKSWIKSKVHHAYQEGHQPTISEIEQEHTLERLHETEGDVTEEETAAWDILQGDASWADDAPGRLPVRDRSAMFSIKKPKAAKKSVDEGSDEA